ncbi:MAG: hypothetical protein PHW66_06305 [Gallionella sp.]|nr:hypothetical protein [Gallionella sp.]
MNAPSPTIFEFLPMIIMIALVFIPTWKIVKKAGYNPWWAVLTLVPLVNLILLWKFASARWPNLR